MTTCGDWLRVTRRAPCSICGKPDWCMASRDGSAVICARIESDRRAGEAGWLHRLRDVDPHRIHRRTIRIPAGCPAPRQDIEMLARRAFEAAGNSGRRRLAAELGLTIEALDRLQVGWSEHHRAWTWPMRDGTGRVIGLHLRREDGSKQCVTGSRLGLFIPADLAAGGQLWMPEGGSDTAALFGLGLAAAGRPSCSGGVRHLVELVRRLLPGQVVVVADRDAPGQRGAEALASVLVAYVPEVRLVFPPGAKDARESVQAGANADDFKTAAAEAPVRRLRVKVRKAWQTRTAKA